MGFTPQFDDTVYVSRFGFPSVRINPQMCATQLSANQLHDVLADLKPTVVMDYPEGFTQTSPFFLSAKVPFLLFPSGYRELAGVIQMWWIRVPDPEGLAERYCRAQIASDQAQYLADKEAAAKMENA